MFQDDKLVIRPFDSNCFAEYRSWFADEQLNRVLGPLDDEWLDCVLNEEPASQFVFHENEEMLAVAGITRATPGHPEFVISDIAVHPQRRRSGIASAVIDLLIQHVAPMSKWVAYVEETNLVACKFFQSIGWICLHGSVTENGMFEFEHRPQESKRHKD